MTEAVSKAKETFAAIISKNIKNRRVVFGGVDKQLEKILQERYGIYPAFRVTNNASNANGKDIFFFDKLKGHASEFYLVVSSLTYNEEDGAKLKKYGYEEIRDYVYFRHKPHVIDISTQAGMIDFIDIYGNRIVTPGGQKLIVTFSGWNSTVVTGKFIKGTQAAGDKVWLSLGSDATVRIGEKVRFDSMAKATLSDESRLIISEGCLLDRTIILMTHGGRIEIGDHCTFGGNLSIRSAYNGEIIIGRDCMFSWEILILGGDGHAVFDVNERKLINGHTLPTKIGEHVWIGAKCNILPKADIGNGSVIGTASTVTKTIPNNCIAAGSPAKVVRKHIVWSRDPAAVSIDQCDSRYIAKTGELLWRKV